MEPERTVCPECGEQQSAKGSVELALGSKSTWRAIGIGGVPVVIAVLLMWITTGWTRLAMAFQIAPCTIGIALVLALVVKIRAIRHNTRRRVFDSLIGVGSIAFGVYTGVVLLFSWLFVWVWKDSGWIDISRE